MRCVCVLCMCARVCVNDLVCAIACIYVLLLAFDVCLFCVCVCVCVCWYQRNSHGLVNA